MKLKQFRLAAAMAAAALGAAGAASAATAPSVIKIGTLYAGSGNFAVASQAQYKGLEFWAKRVNAEGGVYVKAYGKKIPVKIVAYDDQSSTSTATTLYNQLITQDKVDLVVADFGSVLTSVAIPLAKEHKMLLIDPTGSSAGFFKEKTDYLADVSIPSSAVWPVPLAKFLEQEHVKKIGIIYGSNDFDGSQADTLKAEFKKVGITPVFDHAVPTGERNYTVLLHSAAAAQPQALIELGYLPNDVAFLKSLKSSGLHFPFVFTIFPGQFKQLMEKNVGKDALKYTYSYPAPPMIKYEKVNLGMNTDQFLKAWAKTHDGAEANFVNAGGYNAGILMAKAMGTAPKFTQTDLHKALLDMSGKITTVLGAYKLSPTGAQLGQRLPIAQFQPQKDGSLKTVVVYPDSHKTGDAIYPAPQG